MKNIISLFAILFVSLFVSCEQSDVSTEILCEDDCLFTLNETPGSMVWMACFEKFGIKVINSNSPETSHNFIIPDNLEDKYKVGGTNVIVSAICRANILEPLFPDPSFNMEEIFQAKLVTLREKP